MLEDLFGGYAKFIDSENSYKQANVYIFKFPNKLGAVLSVSTPYEDPKKITGVCAPIQFYSDYYWDTLTYLEGRLRKRCAEKRFASRDTAVKYLDGLFKDDISLFM